MNALTSVFGDAVRSVRLDPHRQAEPQTRKRCLRQDDDLLSRRFFDAANLEASSIKVGPCLSIRQVNGSVLFKKRLAVAFSHEAYEVVLTSICEDVQPFRQFFPSGRVWQRRTSIPLCDREIKR